ncbi:hypothetical protein HMPREF3039_01742 [Akkermansia sp. KLE1798]|nr:hypothetical protein HMPREF3039_01742 [Akkermansia sp. KLE1798]KZA05561.1 hypothetical protein HMPREF1326_00736 [Akkermansia sp. KLE1605]
MEEPRSGRGSFSGSEGRKFFQKHASPAFWAVNGSAIMYTRSLWNFYPLRTANVFMWWTPCAALP